MKTLILHHHDSYHKFEGIFSVYVFEIKDGYFYIYWRDSLSGEETIHACFKDWDYFLVEETLD